jgi:hypothetical protein
MDLAVHDSYAECDRDLRYFACFAALQIGVTHFFPGGTKAQNEAIMIAMNGKLGVIPAGQIFHAAGPAPGGWMIGRMTAERARSQTSAIWAGEAPWCLVIEPARSLRRQHLQVFGPPLRARNRAAAVEEGIERPTSRSRDQ